MTYTYLLAVAYILFHVIDEALRSTILLRVEHHPVQVLHVVIISFVLHVVIISFTVSTTFPLLKSRLEVHEIYGG